ncbi:MAG: hypothetical protein IJC48_06605 [Clostridia bacterium]|nr:hypothetical protein [Clostridia bacterium]MBQ4157473.1 hypothetical protein [Clostridia bacterium]
MGFVFLSIVFFLFQNIANKEYSGRFKTDSTTLSHFHLFSHIAMVLSLLLFGASFSLPAGALVLSFLYACAFLSAIMMLMKTYSMGPAGKTALIVNLSMLLSVVLGFIIWKEKISVYRIIGIPCVLMCLLLSVPGKSEDIGKGGRKWLLFAIITFFLDGSLSIIQKTFISIYPDQSVEAFVLDSAVFGLMITIVLNILGFSLKKIEMPRRENMLLFLLLALAVGASTGIATMFNMQALNILDGVIVFPVRQGGLIVLVTVYGIIRYKDKFDLKCAFMMLFGLAGIVLLNL